MCSSQCIWCLEEATDDTHTEHIIPEALGCPPGFTLPGTAVCRRCNNGLAYLDQAVIDEFDLFAFMAGVPRKKGRPPAVRSRGNLLATMESEGPTLTLNMGPGSIKAHDSSHLPAYRGSRRDIRASFKTHGVAGTIAFDLSLGQNRKFVRGIFKIALSSLAFFSGAALAQSAAFNSVRQFVQHDAGNRHLLLMFDNDTKYANRVWPPSVSPEGDYVITLRLACVEFAIDLSNNERSFHTLQAKAPEHLEDNAWCVLPSKA